MQITTEKKSGCVFRITYTYDFAEFQKWMKGVARSVRVPGFRPGHAPLKIVTQIYGEDAVVQQACYDSVKGKWQDVARGAGVTPLSEAQLTVDAYEKDQPVVFNCECYINTQVELGEYKGLKVVAPKTEVTDEMVDQTIASELRKQVSRTEVTDRPCNKNDLVTVDYEGTVDGEPFEGGTSKSATFKLSGNYPYAELNSQIVGMTVGEERDCQVHLPDNFRIEDLRGKEATFHVVLNKITEEIFPVLDDDFVQDVSEFDTVEEYRADIRKKIEDQVAESDEEQLRSRILTAVFKKSQVDPSPVEVQNRAEMSMQAQADEYAKSGIDFFELLKANGLTRESFLKQLFDPSSREIITYALERAIIDAEGITVSEEDMDAYFAKQREILGDTRFEDALLHLTDDQREVIRNTVLLDNLFAMLKENNEITFVAPDDPALKEVPAEENAEEAPAEETAEETAEAAPAEAEAPAGESEEAATEAPAEEGKE